MYYTAERLAEMESAYVADFIITCIRAKVRLPSTEEAAAYFHKALCLEWATSHWIIEQHTRS